ncbi:MAG: hypothetical protein K6F54_08735 [Lachnospiraceae bacterium]|nr:hypothetical protein [Lachnospiraceae bacterium]
MGDASTDPDGYGPSEIISRLCRCIESGVYGLDYTILPREENEEFFEKYLINEQDRIDIIKKLSVDNYDGWDYSDNPKHPKDIVHFFHYRTMLIPRGEEDAEQQSVRLYIKITWTKPGAVLVVISFHD